jgi:hypothetical protein
MQAPKLAAWLLRTVGSGHSTEALLGDLTEECERGRSRGWFWRQVIAAAITFPPRDLRSYKALAVRGIVIGWIVFFGMILIVQKFAIMPLTRIALDGDFSYGLLLIFLLTFSPQIVAGWIAARFHHPHGFAVALGLASSFFVGELALSIAMTTSAGAANMTLWIVSATATLAGGVWGTRSANHRGSAPRVF